MTLKEMIKKINTYNEIAYVMGTDKVVLEISIFEVGCNCCLWNVMTTEFKDIKKAITDEFVNDFANALLTYTDYEFDKDTYINNSIISVRLI